MYIDIPELLLAFSCVLHWCGWTSQHLAVSTGRLFGQILRYAARGTHEVGILFFQCGITAFGSRSDARMARFACARRWHTHPTPNVCCLTHSTRDPRTKRASTERCHAETVVGTIGIKAWDKNGELCMSELLLCSAPIDNRTTLGPGVSFVELCVPYPRG